MANYSTIKVDIDSEDLDIALEKARKLSALLDEVQGKIRAINHERISINMPQLEMPQLEIPKPDIPQPDITPPVISQLKHNAKC